MAIDPTVIPSTSAVDGETIELDAEGALSAPSIPTLLSVASENALDILFLEADASLSNQDYTRAYVSSVDTQTDLTSAHANAFSAAGTYAGYQGAYVVANEAVYVKSFTKNGSVNATSARLYDHTNGVTLGTAAFIGNVATFSEPIALEAGNGYGFQVYAAGATYNSYTATSTDKTSNGLTWTGESEGGGFNALNAMRNIVSVVLDVKLSLDFTPTSCYVYMKGTTTDENVTLSNASDSLAVAPNTITPLTFKPLEINKGSNVLTNGGIAVFFWGGS